MAVEGLTFSQYLYSLNNQQAIDYWLNMENAVNSGQISPNTFAETVENATGRAVTIHRSASGDVLGYTLDRVSTVSTTNPVNSNVSTVARGTVSAPVSTGINGTTGTATASRLAGVGTKLLTGAALVGTAAMCVGTGITLGKTIDSTLYNLNPDFWDSNGMSSLNPETWRSITDGNDSLGASLLNVLFGFDNDGKTQAYIDENAFAYFAAYMQSMGVFNTASSAEIDENPKSLIIADATLPVQLSYGMFFQIYYQGWGYYTIATSAPVLLYCGIGYSYNGMCIIMASKSPFMYGYNSQASSPEQIPTISRATETTVINNETVYYISWTQGGNWKNPSSANNVYPQRNYVQSSNRLNMVELMLFNSTSEGGVDGIGTQTGATTPQGLTGVPSADLPLLQQQYPQLWNNAIDYPVIQDDGTVKHYTYVPVSMPDDLTRTGTQPTSGNATQANPEIDPSTATQELIDFLTKALTNPYPKTEEELNNDNPPENPIDTGDGNSPIPYVPVGSASALWKIYHPTQAQIDSFGGWLWSSNFIDQILKIFNNPMEAVIGLHKVYATPIDAGNTTIKVGYLDSNVPSAYIEQQYIEVDCGSIDLFEQFGNVFDYSPYTDVQLYLPFIGIVPLNVNDVMRSTISIVYGVDVITGACLASVEVSRDGFDTVLYQYSGNCAVQYPISSGSYMGIVSSIISVAGGVAATVASGGAAAPLALGAAGGLLNAHTSVQRSGGFSGNAGAMGNKTPYLIISRPQTKVAENSEEFMGYPTNEYITIGECEGYIKADYAHIINVNATDDELNEINNLLLSGIII